MARVLIIDDDPLHRELVREILSEADITVEEAADGSEGLRGLFNARPDLVVLDINMPQRDGWETLSLIREMSDVPILMLTSNEGEEFTVRALKMGADDFLTTPVKAAELLARVQALMRRRTSPPNPEGGQMVGDYQVEGPIGRGGMGVVLKARHVHLDRVVALKILPPQLAANDVVRERFTREWRMAASLKHPNIVAVHDAGEHGGRLYLAMQYIEGEDLGAMIRREGQLNPLKLAELLKQVAAGLDAAHEAGLVHRDVKPSNLLVDSEGHCFLTDFGLSKLTESNSGITASGGAVGTAEYLSPEQIRGQPVDARTDVYGLGCVMYEGLTGRPPFEEESDFAMIYAHISQTAPHPSQLRPELASALDDVVEKALAKAPDDRYQTAGEAAAALRAASVL